ncbi:MFS multidrug transporter-like protein [Polychaeton citri CBS 116435]|uniref:Cercosporin MFS transporter CTB4 n=1 Tax=Polychaeton citri CBS 116435 TaxID=1314669 RepID=A0A9P4PYP9_9PEZI|nr:MFS multidrug transporter-like protein [Polychaeton citri CBS 116435]
MAPKVPPSRHESRRNSNDTDATDVERVAGKGEKESRSPSISQETSTPATPVKDEEQQQPPKSITDWDGPDDPENPHNWPLWKKGYHTCLPSGIAFVCALGSSIYTPAVANVAQYFEVSHEVAILPFSLFVLGLAFGPSISAPCSEFFGRRLVYQVSIPIFALFTVGAGFSQSIATLCIVRFFAGIFGSPGLSIGSATISDIWEPKKRATCMTLYVTTPFLGPSLGPLIAGFVVDAKGWRWTMWVLLFFTVAFLTPAIAMSETYKPAILRRRAKRLGLHPKKKPFWPTLKAFMRSTMTRPMHMAFTEPIVGLFTIYIALNFAMLYGFFAALPYVFEATYGFGISNTGLVWMSFFVGFLCGSIIVIVYDAMYYKPAVARNKRAGGDGKLAPEKRLYLAMFGSLCLPVSLFWFGWTTRPYVHWIVPTVSLAFFGTGNLLIFMSATLYIMDTYGALFGASAMVANTLLRYTLGCVFPLFAVYMYKGLGNGWATSLLGFISIACLPIPWCFYVWGPKLRAKTGYPQAT